MAQPLPPEPPRPPEAPDRTLGLAELDLDRLDQDGAGDHPHIRLLQEPPERKVTGPRPRPGLRKQRPSLDDTPMPARGAGMTIVSYLIAGIVAYGVIGWLIGRAVHLPVLAPVGMVVGLTISMALIIYRYGRSTPPRIRRFAPKPKPAPEPAIPDDPERAERPDDNDARGTDR
jgi:F0F1-type ATP synthase assembly protein I